MSSRQAAQSRRWAATSGKRRAMSWPVALCLGDFVHPPGNVAAASVSGEGITAPLTS
jgi:hypothetical protein